MVACVRTSHPLRRAFLLDVSHVHLAVRDHGHYLAVGAERRLADRAAYRLDLVVVLFVLVRGDGQHPRLDRGGTKIDDVEAIPRSQHHRTAVGGDVEVHHVVVLERGQPTGRLLAPIKAAQIKVDRRKLAIRRVDHRIIAQPTGHAVVARPLGELGEALVSAIKQPHVSRVGPSIVTTHPTRSAPRKQHLRAAWSNDRKTAERIKHATDVAAPRRDHVRARRAIDVALDGRGERQHLAPLLIDAPGLQRAGQIGARHLPNIGAVGVHDVEVAIAVAVGIERDATAVRAPCGTKIIPRVSGEAVGRAALGGHLPQITPPRENNPTTIRTDRRETRQIDVAALSRSGRSLSRGLPNRRILPPSAMTSGEHKHGTE